MYKPGTCEADLNNSNNDSMVWGWYDLGQADMAPDSPSSIRNQTCKIPVWLSRSSKVKVISLATGGGCFTGSAEMAKILLFKIRGFTKK